MAYQLDRFNGTFFVSVDDQTVNNTATDLRFVGRNYSGYGEIENENFLHLLENFASTSAPPRAITGQTWFDASNKKLKVYDGNKFKVASGAESSATAPAGLTAGDFWYDNQNQQINVWTGTEFVLVGPERTPVYGETSAAPDAVTDSIGTTQNIVKLQVNGQVIAILSNSDFTLSPVINPISGFSEIKKGITFVNSSTSTGVTSSEYRFWGTAANSDRLGGYAASEFLRQSQTSFTTQIGFQDTGIKVGDQGDLQIKVANGNTPLIESYFNQPIVFRLSNNGVDVKDIMLVKTSSVEPGTSLSYDLGTSGSKWRNLYVQTVRAETFYGKFIGEIESTNPDTPISLSSVQITGGFNQTSNNTNFTVNVSGTGTINLTSGATGTINNMNIGTVTAGTASFTTVNANNNVRFTGTGSSSSPSSGTLVVTGGVGIGGGLNVGGDSKFTSTGGIGIPSGTTAQRSPSAVQGMIRFNTTLGEWEGYDGSEWRFIGVSADEDYGLVTEVASVFVDLGGL